jgi:hypothetical protein
MSHAGVEMQLENFIASHCFSLLDMLKLDRQHPLGKLLVDQDDVFNLKVQSADSPRSQAKSRTRLSFRYVDLADLFAVACLCMH